GPAAAETFRVAADRRDLALLLGQDLIEAADLLVERFLQPGLALRLGLARDSAGAARAIAGLVHAADAAGRRGAALRPAFAAGSARSTAGAGHLAAQPANAASGSAAPATAAATTAGHTAAGGAAGRTATGRPA